MKHIQLYSTYLLLVLGAHNKTRLLLLEQSFQAPSFLSSLVSVRDYSITETRDVTPTYLEPENKSPIEPVSWAGICDLCSCPSRVSVASLRITFTCMSSLDNTSFDKQHTVSRDSVEHRAPHHLSSQGYYLLRYWTADGQSAKLGGRHAIGCAGVETRIPCLSADACQHGSGTLCERRCLVRLFGLVPTGPVLQEEQSLVTRTWMRTLKHAVGLVHTISV